jgi:hypothetical protein
MISVSTASTGTNLSHPKRLECFHCLAPRRSDRSAPQGDDAVGADCYQQECAVDRLLPELGIDNALSENPIERNSIAPRRAPTTVPEPPKMLTSDHACGDHRSSYPPPAFAPTPPRRATKSTPAAPAHAPHTRYAMSVRRRTGIPTRTAAGGLLPTAEIPARSQLAKEDRRDRTHDENDPHQLRNAEEPIDPERDEIRGQMIRGDPRAADDLGLDPGNHVESAERDDQGGQIEQRD